MSKLLIICQDSGSLSKLGRIHYTMFESLIKRMKEGNSFIVENSYNII